MEAVKILECGREGLSGQLMLITTASCRLE
jgi:hypothetical protein